MGVQKGHGCINLPSGEYTPEPREHRDGKRAGKVPNANPERE